MFYDDLARALNEEGVRYLMIGGVAVNLHGVVRLTMDVDIATDPSINQSAAWSRVCARLKLYPMRPVTFEQMYDLQERIRLRDEKNLIAFGLRCDDPEDPIVDVLFELPHDFAGAYDRRVIKKINDVEIPLASIDDLIVMKREAGRAKDLSDITELKHLPK